MVLACLAPQLQRLSVSFAGLLHTAQVLQGKTQPGENVALTAMPIRLLQDFQDPKAVLMGSLGVVLLYLHGAQEAQAKRGFHIPSWFLRVVKECDAKLGELV